MRSSKKDGNLHLLYGSINTTIFYYKRNDKSNFRKKFKREIDFK